MSFYLNGAEIGNLRLNGIEMDKAYLNGVKVFQRSPISNIQDINWSIYSSITASGYGFATLYLNNTNTNLLLFANYLVKATGTSSGSLSIYDGEGIVSPSSFYAYSGAISPTEGFQKNSHHSIMLPANSNQAEYGLKIRPNVPALWYGVYGLSFVIPSITSIVKNVVTVSGISETLQVGDIVIKYVYSNQAILPSISDSSGLNYIREVDSFLSCCSQAVRHVLDVAEVTSNATYSIGQSITSYMQHALQIIVILRP